MIVVDMLYNTTTSLPSNVCVYVVPGPVSNLSYNIISTTSAVIMWSEPEEPNGVITGYDVVYGLYEEDNSTTVDVKELILAIGNLSGLSHTSTYVLHTYHALEITFSP